MAKSSVDRSERPPSVTREKIAEEAAQDGHNAHDWDVLTRLLVERYSCRAFLPQPVARETLSRLFSVAQLTASWCNAQPWEVIVTEGKGTERFRAALLEHAIANPTGRQSDFDFPERYEGVYDQRRKDCGWALYESVGVSRGDRTGSGRQMLENYRLFGAPHVLILTSEADLGTYGAVDCGIYLGNLMLVMQSLGMASIPQAALARFSSFIREYFGIPEHRRVLVGLSFGYPDPDHPANSFRTPRAAIESVARWVED